jgi:manganese efflux pump family protein
VNLGINPAELLLIALSLAVDCFAVAVSGSITQGRFSRGQLWRLAGAFGGAQFLMNLAGWFAGRTVVEFIAAYDHWVAFVLLAIVGGRMIWEFFKADGGQKGADITRGWLLVTMALATSLDSLAVGLSFAFIDVNVWAASITIGVVALVVALVGGLLGAKLGELFGRWARLAGGIVLIGIGLRILITHLLGM